MNKLQIINQLAEDFGLTKRLTDQIINKFLSTIQNEVGKGKKVKISGFGVFDTHTRVARNGINPNTGQKLKIPASKTVHFTAGTQFKEAIRRSKA